MSKYYVTTPIYYVNDQPHIGHIYSTTIADVLARYRRLRGDEVFFLTGTDEHAAKVVDSAAERDMSPIQWADRNAKAFEETFERLGMSNTDFIRTSQDRHKTRVQEYVKVLLESGDVYLGEYKGWYDAGQEEYVTDSNAKAYDYKSPINGKPLVSKTEKNYFFKLSQYGDQILQWLSDHPEAVKPEARKNEVIGRIREGLNDVPISRTGTGGWGIEVPGDPEHSIYVWIDALFNYLTTIDKDDRRDFWPANVHLIAKDILWFHAVIWPAILMAMQKQPGYEWVKLPDRIYAHSFWISEGKKMSKSLGNFIDLEKIDYFVETFGLDSLRYFLASNGPMGVTDADFSEARFIEVYNSELANTFGNCANRIANMTSRYFDGKLPAIGPHISESDQYNNAAKQAVEKYVAAMDKLHLSAAIDASLGLVRVVNTYIDQTEPFKRAKDADKLPEVGTILYHCAEAIRMVSVMLWPIMPHKMNILWQQFGCQQYVDALADNGVGDFEQWTQWGQLQPGTLIEKGEPLFPRFQVPKK